MRRDKIGRVLQVAVAKKLREKANARKVPCLDVMILLLTTYL